MAVIYIKRHTAGLQKYRLSIGIEILRQTEMFIFVSLSAVFTFELFNRTELVQCLN